jgi:hypothetical protein
LLGSWRAESPESGRNSWLIEASRFQHGMRSASPTDVQDERNSPEQGAVAAGIGADRATSVAVTLDGGVVAAEACATAGETARRTSCSSRSSWWKTSRHWSRPLV